MTAAIKSKKTLRKRGRSPTTQVPEDWDEAARLLLWRLYEEREGRSRPDHLEQIREDFFKKFQFPALRVRELTHVKTSHLQRIADHAGIDLDGLLQGIALWSQDPRAKDMILGPKPSRAIPPSSSSLEVFLSRREVLEDKTLLDMMQTATGIDMVALSAAVAGSLYGLFFEQALSRENFHCRLVLLDPSAATKPHYNAMVKNVLEEKPAKKREQFKKLWSRATGRLEIKVLRDIPLNYNLWLAKSPSGEDVVGHISAYSYNSDIGAYSFRGRSGHPLVSELRKEFDFVWQHVAVRYDSPDRSKQSVKTRRSAYRKA